MKRAFLLIVLACQITLADVSKDLEYFFNSLGFAGNITKGHAYEGQAANYYSGGSVYLRNQVKSAQLIDLDTPSFRSGCGGIDIYAGGFSFINKEEFIRFLKNIMNNAAGYAFNLALQTAVPQIANTMQYMQKIAQDINSAHINSCEMAESLVGGVWPKIRASQQQICQDIGNQDNIFADWTSARQGCTVGGDFDNQMQRASEDKNYKKRVIWNSNLMWEVIQSNSFLNNDNSLAELFMSLSGTMIFDKKGNVRIYPSFIDNRDLIKTLLYGGSTKIYSCNDYPKCMAIEIKESNIAKDQALINQVNRELLILTNHLKEDRVITDKQRGFINSTNIPILRFMSVLAESNVSINIAQYSEMIAIDILIQYLEENLKIIDHSLAGYDYPAEIQIELQQKIDKGIENINQMRRTNYIQLKQTNSLIERMQNLEEQIMSNLASTLDNNL